jgi:hypothetical protein
MSLSYINVKKPGCENRIIKLRLTERQAVKVSLFKSHGWKRPDTPASRGRRVPISIIDDDYHDVRINHPLTRVNRVGKKYCALYDHLQINLNEEQSLAHWELIADNTARTLLKSYDRRGIPGSMNERSIPHIGVRCGLPNVILDDLYNNIAYEGVRQFKGA